MQQNIHTHFVFLMFVYQSLHVEQLYIMKSNTVSDDVLQRFFAKHEFSAPFQLCCSDCEPLLMSALLANADPASKKMCDYFSR